MAVDPGLGDGVRAYTSRPPMTLRSRLVIVGVIIGIGMLAAAGTAFLGGHKRHETTEAKSIASGMPFSAPAEIKPTPAVEHPMTPPQMPVIRSSYARPSKDNAIEAPIFASASAYQGAEANRQGGMNGSSGNGEKDDEFTAAMTASGVGGKAKAKRMKHPELTVPAGIVIPCILQTAINSELVGFVDCVLPAEVRSADGSVTLMDKGTTVMGQIKSGLRRGQERLFILWTRARTPDSVTVDLASPAADELGRAGVGCNEDASCVNTHFWKMFWTAALYSLIEYGPQLGVAAIQNQNHSGFNNYTTFLQPQQSLANTILQDDLHIPPTLEKNQGDVVSIFVARDLDFSGVYDLSMTGSMPSTCDGCAPAVWTTEKSLSKNR